MRARGWGTVTARTGAARHEGHAGTATALSAPHKSRAQPAILSATLTARHVAQKRRTTISAEFAIMLPRTALASLPPAAPVARIEA